MASGIKTGEREKGTPNKLTFQTRQLLTDVLADEIEGLPAILERLEPHHRIDAICKLSKFVLPQMIAIHATKAEQRGMKPTDDTMSRIEHVNKLERGTFL